MHMHMHMPPHYIIIFIVLIITTRHMQKAQQPGSAADKSMAEAHIADVAPTPHLPQQETQVSPTETPWGMAGQRLAPPTLPPVVDVFPRPRRSHIMLCRPHIMLCRPRIMCSAALTAENVCV